MPLELDDLPTSADSGRGFRGHVRLMCNSTALSAWLPDRLAAFLSGHPGITVDLDERPSQRIADALRGSVCDIGVLADSVDTAGLEKFVLGSDPLVLAVPRTHALAGQGPVDFNEVSRVELIGLRVGSPLDEYMADHAALLGIRPPYRVRLPSFGAVCRMVGRGVGVAVLPQSAVLRSGAALGVVAVALKDAWAERSLVLCVRDLEALPAYAQQLVAQVLEPRGRAAPRR